MEFLPNSKNFKILELSNATWTPSGYGVQSKGMLYPWNSHYNVRQLCNYGIEGAWMNINGLQHYPCIPQDDSGDRTARIIFGSWNPDVFVTLYDIWMGAYVNLTNGVITSAIHPHWVPIVMVDHAPIPKGTLACASAAYRVVVPTRYGESEFKRNGVRCEYIPFGIDTETMKPSEDSGADKEWLNARSEPYIPEHQTPLTKDKFLITMVGANKDPNRKGYPRGFLALNLFLANNPDAKKDVVLYTHTWLRMARDLPDLAKTLDVAGYCRGPSLYSNLCGANEKDMARVYGATDLFLHPSEGGGFEVPILEAESCGVSVIASDFICMSELVNGRGWKVPPIVSQRGGRSLYFSPLNAMQQIDDEYLLADAIEDAYSHDEKREAYGRAGREYALGFDWPLVNEKWYELFESIRNEWRTPPLSERRL